MAGVGIDLSGPLFGLTAHGGVEEELGSARGGIGVTVDVLAAAQLCNGIEAGLGVSASGQADGVAQAFDLVGLAATGRAQAQARVNARAQLAPNVFKRFGATAGAEAIAEAAVYGRIAVNVTVQRLVELLEAEIDDPVALRLVLLFLEEVELEGGIWAKAAFTAQASAVAEVAGRLGDTNSEWSIRTRVSAGFEAGAGVEVYLGLRTDQGLRLYRRAVDEVVGMVVDEVRPHLPPHLRPALETAHLAAPMLLEAAYVFGQLDVLGTVGNADSLVAPFVRTCAERGRQWIAERGVDIGLTLLREAVETHLGVQLAALSQDQRTELAQGLTQLAQMIRTGRDDEATVLSAVGGILDLFDVALGGLPVTIIQPVTTIWASAVVALAARGTLDGATGRVAVDWLGGGTGPLTAVAASLERPPAVVVEEVERVLGRPAPRPDLSDAVDYLVAVLDRQVISAHAPAVADALAFLSDTFGLSAGVVVEDLLRLQHDPAALTATQTYRRLRDGASEAVRTFIDDLVDEVPREQLPPHARVWIDEAIRPAVPVVADFVFDQVDEMVADLAAGQPLSMEATLSSLQIGASRLVVKLVGFQVIVLGDLVDQLGHDGLTTGAQALADALDAEDDGPLGHMVGALTATYLPILVVDAHTRRHRDRARRLMTALLRAAGTTLGTSYATAAGRRRRRQNLRDLLDALDGYVDPSGSGFEDAVRELAECLLPVEVRAPAERLLGHELELYGRAAPALIMASLHALTDYALDAGEAAVLAADAAISAFIDQLEALVQTAWSAWQQLDGMVQDLSAQIDLALAGADAVIEVIRSRFLSSALLTTLVGEVRAALSAAEEALHTGMPLDEITSTVTALIGGALDDFATLLDDLAGVVLDDIREAIADARSLNAAVTEAWALIDEAVEQHFAAGVGLLGSDDLRTEVRQAIGLTWLREQIAAYRRHRADARALDSTRDDAADQAAEAGRRYDARRSELRGWLSGGLPTVRILAPSGLGVTGAAVGYAAPVHLLVETSAPLTHLTGDASPIVVLVGARRVPIVAEAWTEGPGGRVASVDLTAHLGAGINLVEVAVVDGSGTPVSRDMIVLAFDPDAPALPGRFEVVDGLTVIDAPGDDHRVPAEEFVTLRWVGSAPMTLNGWRLADDGYRHVYDFADVTLDAGGVFTLVTGGDATQDTPTRLHWGRSSAVWNNRGDRILMLDEARRVRLEVTT